MSRTPTYTLLEYKHLRGQAFSIIHGKNGLLATLSEDILVRIGKEPVVVNHARLTGDITTLFWRWFEDTTVTSTDPAKAINEIRRNSALPNSSGVTAFYDPIIGDDGDSLVPSGFGVNGVTTENGRSWIDSTILEQNYTFRANTDYLIRVTNNGTTTRNFEFSLDYHMLND